MPTGSSPRVRGTQRNDHDPGISWRFIPAGAGNTNNAHPHRGRSPVHPRGCGEHAFGRLATPIHPGSSPRVRGTRSMTAVCAVRGRFIPAGAGNTWQETSALHQSSVHPRGCGEHLLKLRLALPCAGSSPRVRGTQVLPVPRGHWLRFIPAGAGNTAKCREYTMLAAVHPRGCGEHLTSPLLVPY